MRPVIILNLLPTALRQAPLEKAIDATLDQTLTWIGESHMRRNDEEVQFPLVPILRTAQTVQYDPRGSSIVVLFEWGFVCTEAENTYVSV